MKKTTKTALIAASFALAIGLTGCVPPGDNNDDIKIRTKSDEIDLTDDDVVCVYGPPSDYDPDNDDPQDVYGPPSDFGEPDDDVQTEYSPPIAIEEED